MNRLTFKKQLSLESSILNWVIFMSNTGGVHGLSWFNYFQKPVLKGLVLAFALGCFCFIPLYFYTTLCAFLKDDSIFSKEVTRKMHEVRFPHVTLCHPFYFSKAKMLGNKYQLVMNPKKLNTELSSIDMEFSFHSLSKKLCQVKVSEYKSNSPCVS